MCFKMIFYVIKMKQDYLSRVKYLVVDEYQDVNDLQEKLILRIVETGANICVVGDDDQTTGTWK